MRKTKTEMESYSDRGYQTKRMGEEHSETGEVGKEHKNRNADPTEQRKGKDR